MFKLPQRVPSSGVIVVLATLIGACAPGIENSAETTPLAPAQALPVLAAAIGESPVASLETSLESSDTSTEAVLSPVVGPPTTPDGIAPVSSTESTSNPFTLVDAESAASIDALDPGEQESAQGSDSDSTEPDSSQEEAGNPAESETGEPVVEPEVQEPRCAPGYYWVEDTD